MTKPLPPRFVAVAAACSLAGCAAIGLGGNNAANLIKPLAVAHLKGQSGLDRGRVEVFRDGADLRLEIVAREFQPGRYGMHVHAVGKCDAPDFTSAGPHWNPTGAQHGADNPLGAHRGDLPNLEVEAGQIGRVTVTIPTGSLNGDNGLLDGDGAAFIIHAQADDLMTDPSGNSGGRIVCGVFGTE
jgi:superoxide dismutase, Cu-Zn family